MARIDIETPVYERLAEFKREDESFSAVIDRLLADRGRGPAHTGRDILEGLQNVEPLSEEDARVFLQVIEENRSNEPWDRRDLR